MCDFKPGDEVIFVGGEGDRTGAPPLGWIGRVVEVVGAIDPEWPLVIGFTLDNWPLPPGGAECQLGHGDCCAARDLRIRDPAG